MSAARFQILLIDDMESDANLFAMALRDAAPRVKLFWVATAQEGVEYLRKENRFQDVGPVSIIVCDLNLPGMNGLDFVATVKGDPALASIPLVVYSGSAEPQDILRSYALGANSYLVKPMTMETLIHQVKALVHYWLEIARLPEPRLLD